MVDNQRGEKKSLVLQDGALEKARALVKHLEAGEEDEAIVVLDELSKTRESDLFVEIGKLTRELHEALNSFQLDDRIMDLTAQDIPDAKDRLEYVISMTESAANKTMDAIESCIPVSDNIGKKSQDLLVIWEKLMQKQLQAGEFRELCKNTENFLKSTKTDADTLHTQMTQVLMAQDYQDLTGQVIRKVIKLVHEVEESLVTMIKMFGCMGALQDAQERETVSAVEAEGPIINPEKREDVVQNQDDVDDLLSSLGF